MTRLSRIRAWFAPTPPRPTPPHPPPRWSRAAALARCLEAAEAAELAPPYTVYVHAEVGSPHVNIHISLPGVASWRITFQWLALPPPVEIRNVIVYGSRVIREAYEERHARPSSTR